MLAQGVDIQTVTKKNAAKSESRSGTSYACAYISGICAKIWSEEPDLSAAQVYQKLIASAQDIGEAGYDEDSGWGIVSEETLSLQETDGLVRFLDTETHWAKESISFCVKNGIFRGVCNERFDPNGSMTKAMLVTILYRLVDTPKAERGEAFSDIEDGEWYSDTVFWASSIGILKGDENGRSDIHDKVTLWIVYIAVCDLRAMVETVHSIE